MRGGFCRAILGMLVVGWVAIGASEPGSESSLRPSVHKLRAGGGRSFASFSHSCVQVSDHIQCWGAGGSGQLGDGLAAVRRPLPVRVDGLPGPASELALGEAHSCALIDGTVFCWGQNDSGQSGVERPLTLLSPVRVPSLPGPVTALAAGEAHTCAATADTLWCWGRNGRGEAGHVPADSCRGRHAARPCRTSPTPVVGIDVRPDALALGARHSCALANGEVQCWGANSEGQLGDGNTDWRARPKPVLGLPGLADHIVAGRSHSCASVEGILHCWGANAAGQLGVDEVGDQLSPVAVTALLAPPTALAAGGDQTCAVVEGQVLCWGNGRSVPTPVEGIAGDVTSLAVGFDNGCAVLDQVSVYCWGENDFGQIGSGDAPEAHPGATAIGAWDRGHLRDRDGDGRIVVSCLGDSNTHTVEGGVTSWCDRLAERLPSDSWHVINRGFAGATAVIRASTLHAGSQMNYTLENDFPDAVILAFGTNDLLAEMDSAEVVDAYRSLALRVYAAGALPFVALTPPIQPAASGLNVRVRELNGALRAAFDEGRMIDFWSGFGADDFEDALHLADSGQARRTEIAAVALFEAAPAEMR